MNESIDSDSATKTKNQANDLMNDVLQGLWRDFASMERHDYDGTVDLVIN